MKTISKYLLERLRKIGERPILCDANRDLQNRFFFGPGPDLWLHFSIDSSFHFIYSISLLKPSQYVLMCYPLNIYIKSA